MGWFWANTASSPSITATPPHPPQPASATPPPSCPMHKAAPAVPLSAPPAPSTPSDSSACPYVPPDTSPSATSGSVSSTLSKLNPLNYMPANLSNQRSTTQKSALPLERELSSIPKGDGDGNWEYPSPQQMYNAMLRKGYTDTDETAVESMVAVHNFLNEGAWAEIMEWERRFGSGLKRGWEESRKGEEGSHYSASSEMIWRERDLPAPQLLRFMGRPGELTPKAKFLQTLGWAWPSRFGGEPPFDRHDWFVKRRAQDGSTEEVRYVIDYYSGPPEPTGEPVFFLDVRPAIDTPSAAVARMMRWGGDIWYRGSGGSVREAVEKANAAKS